MVRLVVAGMALLFASEARAQTPTASFPVESDEPRAPAPDAAPVATAPAPSAARVTPATTPPAARVTPATTLPAPIPPSTPPAPKYLNYRGYLFLSDAAAITVMLAGAAAESTPLAATGAGVYALGGPTIHLAHHQGGRAVASLALRIGAPLLLGLGGYALGASDCGSPSSPSDPSAEPDNSWGFGCGLTEIIFTEMGVGMGMLAAILVDDIALGKVRVGRPRTPANAASSAASATGLHPEPDYRIGVAPFIATRGQGGGMMLVGTF